MPSVRQREDAGRVSRGPDGQERRERLTDGTVGRAFATVASIVLMVAYPLTMYWALTHFSARAVGVLGLAVAVPVFAFRFRNANRAHLVALRRIPLVVMALLLAGAVFDERFMLAFPVLMNVAFLVTFASSLSGEMPIIERFARMRHGELSEPKVRHCRQFTWVWCAFFVLNAAAAAALASAPRDA